MTYVYWIHSNSAQLGHSFVSCTKWNKIWIEIKVGNNKQNPMRTRRNRKWLSRLPKVIYGTIVKQPIIPTKTPPIKANKLIKCTVPRNKNKATKHTSLMASHDGCCINLQAWNSSNTATPTIPPAPLVDPTWGRSGSMLLPICTNTNYYALI